MNEDWSSPFIFPGEKVLVHISSSSLIIRLPEIIVGVTCC